MLRHYQQSGSPSSSMVVVRKSRVLAGAGSESVCGQTLDEGSWWWFGVYTASTWRCVAAMKLKLLMYGDKPSDSAQCRVRVAHYSCHRAAGSWPSQSTVLAVHHWPARLL